MALFGKKHQLNSDEMAELNGIKRAIVNETFKLMIVSKNTIRVPDGRDWIKQQEAIVTLLKEAQEEFIQISNTYLRYFILPKNITLQMFSSISLLTVVIRLHQQQNHTLHDFA